MRMRLTFITLILVSLALLGSCTGNKENSNQGIWDQSNWNQAKWQEQE